MILCSALERVFLSHYEAGPSALDRKRWPTSSGVQVAEILAFAELVPYAVPGSVAGALLAAERLFSYVPGFRRRAVRNPYLRGLSSLNLYHQVCNRIRASSTVWIAAINGRALGGGCELSLACDFRLMVDGPLEDGHAIGQPEVILGLIPGGGGTQMLARCVGNAKALEFALEGRPIPAQEAYSLGLVTKIVPEDQLLSEARQLAERMATRSRYCVAAVKACIHQGASKSMGQGLQMEQAEFAACAGIEGHRKAMRRYLEVKNKLWDSGNQSIEEFQSWVDGKEVNLGATV